MDYRITDVVGEPARAPECIVSFIVPALNEAGNLPPLAARLCAVGGELGVPYEILIIDDASDDDTAAVADGLAREHVEIRLLRRSSPSGLGRAVRLGIQESRGQAAVVVMADGVDPLEEAVPQLVREITANGCDLVLLSRYTDPRDADSIPSSYRSLQVVFRLLTRYVLAIRHPDTTYAFRALRVEFMRQLGLRSNGFEISPEITFKTVLAGGKVGEVAGRQTRRVIGLSKFRFLKAAIGYTRVVLEALAYRLRILTFSPTRSSAPARARLTDL